MKKNKSNESNKSNKGESRRNKSNKSKSESRGKVSNSVVSWVCRNLGYRWYERVIVLSGLRKGLLLKMGICLDR